MGCFIRIKTQAFISGRTLNATLLKGVTVPLKKRKMMWWNEEMDIKARESSKILKKKKITENDDDFLWGLQNAQPRIHAVLKILK